MILRVFDASFSFDRIESNQIEGDVLEQGEVVRGRFAAPDCASRRSSRSTGRRSTSRTGVLAIS